jgi:hypothetical protein
MGVTRQAGVIADGKLAIQRQEIRRPVHRLDGTEAEARQACLGQNRCNQVFESLGLAEVAPPTAEIDAGQYQFLTALIDKALHIIETDCERHGAGMSPCGWNNAERAAIAASVLDFEIRPRLLCIGRKGQRGQVGVRERIVMENFADGNEILPDWDIRCPKAAGYFGNQRFVAVSDDCIDFGHRGQFLGRALRVTAGYDHPGIGVLAANAAQPSAGLTVSLCGNATGVYNNDMS